MKKIIKISTAITGIIITLIFSLIVYGDLTIPDDAKGLSADGFNTGIYTISAKIYEGSEKASDKNTSRELSEIRLSGIFPVKTVSTAASDRMYLIPGGELVGLRLKTDGVLVVGTEDFEAEQGTVNPAKEAGIRVGDTLVSIDDIEISTNAQLAEIIASSDGEPLEAEIMREGQEIEITITPEISTLTGLYKCGLWIRDSTGGIGTLTYYDVENAAFATLGHGIYDTDTGTLLPTSKGEISSATLTGIRKGTAGSAGELKGAINSDVFGNIISNNENGIYGSVSVVSLSSDAMPIAYDSEIKTGYAQILCTVEGNEKAYYDVEIEKISKGSENKNLVVRVTDERLLELTGGIVQGMSGSPIIQNGRIIGAVTHVFVNEPTRGYGITIENMLKTQDKLI